MQECVGFTHHGMLLQAYSTLSNPMSRLKYNAQLEQALQDEEDDYSGQLHASDQAVTPILPVRAHISLGVSLGFAGQPLSKWLVGHKMGKNVDPVESRAVFVVSLFNLVESFWTVQQWTASKSFDFGSCLASKHAQTAAYSAAPENQGAKPHGSDASTC